MSQKPLGRTNQVFPSVWLSLRTPNDVDQIDPLVATAIESELPIDVSAQPALWGGRVRGVERTFIASGVLDYARATDEKHACDLTQAHLIQTLSCLGRESLDFYLLRVRRAVEEFQIAGVMVALEMARQEGHLRFLGLLCDGPALASLGLWQFHDAFEVVVVGADDAEKTLAPVASDRRVGLVRQVDSNDEWESMANDRTLLAAVRSVTDVDRARSIAGAIRA